MSYYKLQNLCQDYKESGTAITSNKKYTDPFLKGSNGIALYNDNNTRLNSYIFNQNNFHQHQ